MPNITEHLIQISDFLVLEYQYNSTTFQLSGNNSSGLLQITNPNNNSITKISYNEKDQSVPKNKIKNDLNRTAIQTSGNVWLRLNDQEPFINFSSAANGLVFESQFQNESSTALIVYDRVRLYFINGYNFRDFPGLICEVSIVKRNGEIATIMASQVILGSENPFELLPKSKLIGQRLYDKYIEFYVPSLNELVQPIRTLPTSFLFDDPNYREARGNDYFNSDYLSPKIQVRLYQIYKYINNFNGSTFLNTIPFQFTSGFENAIFDIEKMDQDSLLSAYIQPSASGDYFEYYPLYDNDFINGYVDRRSRRGDLIQVEHNIRVIEHTATQEGYKGECETYSFVHIENVGFDKPHLFRPIVTLGSSVAFSIEYEMRLVNRLNNTSVVRQAFYTSKNVTKYGHYIAKINTKLDETPVKIINKVVNNSIELPSTMRESVIMPSIYDSKMIDGGLQIIAEEGAKIFPIDIQNISVSDSNVFIDGFGNALPYIQGSVVNSTDISNVDQNMLRDSSVIWRQGEAIINLNSINNYVKFSFYQINPGSPPVLFSDLKEDEFTKMTMGFVDNKNNSIRIGTIQNTNVQLNSGEFIFQISSNLVKQLKTFTNNNFYIYANRLEGSAVKNRASTETSAGTSYVLYSGQFYIDKKLNEINALRDIAKSNILDSKIDIINSLTTKLTSIKDALEKTLTTSSLSTDINIAISQKQDISVLQAQLEQLIKEQALAENIDISQTDLLTSFQEKFKKLLG